MTTLPELAARVRMIEMPPARDQVLALSDMDIDYAIAKATAAAAGAGGDTGAAGTVRVERRERGGAPRVMLRGTDRATAERFLAVLLAADLRATEGLRPLGTGSRGVADGFEVVEDSGNVRLVWSTGSAVFPGPAYGRRDAEAFSHFATASIDDIIARHGL